MKNFKIAAVFSIVMPALFVGQVYSAAEVAQPLISPSYVTKAPVIDGKMSNDEWDNVTMITGFVGINHKLHTRQTKVWTAFDDDNLYFCFQSFSPNWLKGEIKERDSGLLFRDDVIELFLQPEGLDKYYQFATNTLGTKYDSRIHNSSWDGNWQVSCGVVKDKWFVAWLQAYVYCS